MPTIAFVHPHRLRKVVGDCARRLNIEIEFCEDSLDQMAPEDRASINVVIVDESFARDTIPHVLWWRTIVLDDHDPDDLAERMNEILRP